MIHILCVEDHADSAEMLRLSLQIEGYAVAVANTVDDALALMKQESFDLYVLDVYLPGIDGLALCRTIRATDLNIPILIYAAGAYKTEIDEARMAGATRYLIKPDGY